MYSLNNYFSTEYIQSLVLNEIYDRTFMLANLEPDFYSLPNMINFLNH